MHENITNTQKYMVPVAGMKAVNASDVEVVDLPPRKKKKKEMISTHARFSSLELVFL